MTGFPAHPSREWPCHQSFILLATGRMYDKKGNFGVQWWTNKSVDGFEVKADCLIKQYDQYSYYGKHVSQQQLLSCGIEWGQASDNCWVMAYVARGTSVQCFQPGITILTSCLTPFNFAGKGKIYSWREHC